METVHQSSAATEAAMDVQHYGPQSSCADSWHGPQPADDGPVSRRLAGVARPEYQPVAGRIASQLPSGGRPDSQHRTLTKGASEKDPEPDVVRAIPKEGLRLPGRKP